MPPARRNPADTEAAKKRKRDKAEDRDDRKARKKQRSKSKPHPGADGDRAEDDGAEDAQHHTLTETGPKEAETYKGHPIALHGQTDGSRGLELARGHASQLASLSSPWKLSKPMGGRMLDVDPVFSEDEEHLLLVYNTSVQVYSTADSLLVRRIPLAVSGPAKNEDEDEETAGDRPSGVHVVSAALSRDSPHQLWVASTDGRIWCIDWTTGAGADTPSTLQAKKILDMTVDQAKSGEVPEDVVLVLERTSHSGAQVVAYDREALSTRSGKTLHTCDDNPHMLRSANGSSAVVVATRNSVHIGISGQNQKTGQKTGQKNKDAGSLGGLSYQFFAFDMEDHITTLDLRATSQATKHGPRTIVDLAVGCARGAILMLTDVLTKLPGAPGAAPRRGSFLPRSLHWHAQAVHSVKWSRDGNYLISGGSEGVLVLWQLDTGKKDFLPHLSASIENIVVSPTGSSYAVHLDDNSAMVLSTAEMKPTTYISGIQSLSFRDRRPKDSLVRRVWQEPDYISAPVPAAASPANPSRILVSAGNGQKSTLAEGKALSAPYLQVFDLESSQSVAKQAVARANPTDARVSAKGYPLAEPTVTKIAFSCSGEWLATVDEWQPPDRDLEPLTDGCSTAAELCSGRREIFLKFWEAGRAGDGSVSDEGSFRLASRINEAHYSDRTEAIFDLAGDPGSTRFATVGGDGAVRLWSPKLRQNDGLAVTTRGGENLYRWACTQTVSLERAVDREEELTGRGPAGSVGGALDFSEDGSTLFVAYGAGSGAVVYVIDAETGQVRDRLLNMYRGPVRELKVVASCLVMLSDELNVFNVVSDELHYGVSLKKHLRGSPPLLQLAVNRRSRSFALAMPLLKPTEKPKRGTVSELAIFSIDNNQPQLVRTLPHLITSLFPARSSSGFLVVDSAAQVWSVGSAAESSILAQPLADMRLDKEPASAPADGQLALLTNGEEDAASDEEMEDVGADAETEDYDIHPAVVAPQRLAEIFNAGPAFAMPPIEDTFYQVTGLLAAKPLRAATA